MKLTPEQKAHYEYGEARGVLKERKSLMRFTECLGECSDYHGDPRLMYGVEDAIRDAWQKRAACRVWQVKERYCGNCKYSDYSEWDVPCCECSHANIVESLDRWEPRKEGE